MSLRFVGSEQLQRGRGIGGLLRLMKSVFSPLVRKVGSTVVSAAKSKGAKKLLNVLKDQAIDSSMALASDALRGQNMNTSLTNELDNAKLNLSSTIDELRKNRKRSRNQTGEGVKRKRSKKTNSKQLKRANRTKTKIKKRKSKFKKKKTKKRLDFFKK